WVEQRVENHAIEIYDTTTGPLPPPFHLRDVNRDGLPDIVSEAYVTFPSGVAAAAEAVLINRGVTADRTGCDDGGPPPPAGTLLFAPPLYRGSTSGGTINFKHPPSIADIDGDGFYDVVDYYPSTDIPETGTT